MFDRLKSLPLTIMLTLLIWMYAESQVSSARNESRLEIRDLPVLVSGPPEVVGPNQIMVEPKVVTVEIAGPKEEIDAMRGRAAADSGVYAYLDIEAGDKPISGMSYRQVRVAPPAGIRVTHAPQVGFRLTAIQAATGR